MPRQLRRIDLEQSFRLEDVRSKLISPRQVWREFGLPIALQNRLDEEGMLRRYAIGSYAVFYREDVENMLAALPPCQGETETDAAAAVVAELESVLRLIQLVRRARRPAHAEAA